MSRPWRARSRPRWRPSRGTRSSLSMTARRDGTAEQARRAQKRDRRISGPCAMTAIWARAAASIPACMRPRATSSSPWTATARTIPPTFPSSWRSCAPIPSLGMVSGVRVKRQDTASRRIASRLGNGFRNAMLGDGATDTGCGIKAFYRAAFLDASLFRSHAPLSDRAGAASWLEGRAMCPSITAPG